MKKSNFFLRYISLVCILFTLPLQAFASNNKQIDKIQAPYLVSIWSIDEATKQRKEYLCNGFIIDRNFALTNASCIKNAGGIGGSYGHMKRLERGFSYSIWGWTWPTGFEDNPVSNNLALIYAPFGISPWDKDLKIQTSIPEIAQLGKESYGLISWSEVNGEYILNLSTVKIVKTPSKQMDQNLNNIFYGSLTKKGIKAKNNSCDGIAGSPLISTNKNGVLKVVGIVSPEKGKCGSSNLVRFLKISQFNNFIESEKAALISDHLNTRNGEPVKPILDSVRPSNSIDYIASKVGNDGRESSIWIGYDPESGLADVWSMSFNVWQSNIYEVSLMFRNEIDGCTLSKKGSVHLQLSKNSSQNIHYSAVGSDPLNCWQNGKDYYYKEIMNSSDDSNLFCSMRVTPYGNNWSVNTQDKVKYLSLDINRGCLGIASKVWVRFSIKIDNEYSDNDIEPFSDGWYGPWQSTIFNLE